MSKEVNLLSVYETQRLKMKMLGSVSELPVGTAPGPGEEKSVNGL